MKIAFVTPVNGITGGLYVVYQHAHYLKRQGHEVEILVVSTDLGLEVTCFPNFSLPVKAYHSVVKTDHSYDVVFATWWETAYDILLLKSKHYLFFCQDDERRFYSDLLDPHIPLLERLYRNPGFQFITEAKWIQNMFKNEFQQEIEYAPNGIDLNLFHPDVNPLVPRPTDKIRLMIEGPGGFEYKRVGLAFQAVADIPNTEIWYVSKDGHAENHWKYDRLFKKLAINEMPSVYASCDILVKLSSAEGFFGPPLEMMACGGTAVVTSVTGFDEYVVHEENALVVPLNDAQAARESVIRLINDPNLRKRLSLAGIETAKSLSWEKQMPKFEQAILACISKQGEVSHQALSAAKEQAVLHRTMKRCQDLETRAAESLSRLEEVERKLYEAERKLYEVQRWRPYRHWKGIQNALAQLKTKT